MTKPKHRKRRAWTDSEAHKVLATLPTLSESARKDLRLRLARLEAVTLGLGHWDANAVPPSDAALRLSAVAKKAKALRSALADRATARLLLSEFLLEAEAVGEPAGGAALQRHLVLLAKVAEREAEKWSQETATDDDRGRHKASRETRVMQLAFQTFEELTGQRARRVVTHYAKGGEAAEGGAAVTFTLAVLDSLRERGRQTGLKLRAVSAGAVGAALKRWKEGRSVPVVIRPGWVPRNPPMDRSDRKKS